MVPRVEVDQLSMGWDTYHDISNYMTILSLESLQFHSAFRELCGQCLSIEDYPLRREPFWLSVSASEQAVDKSVRLDL